MKNLTGYRKGWNEERANGTNWVAKALASPNTGSKIVLPLHPQMPHHSVYFGPICFTAADGVPFLSVVFKGTFKLFRDNNVISEARTDINLSSANPSDVNSYAPGVPSVAGPTIAVADCIQMIYAGVDFRMAVPATKLFGFADKAVWECELNSRFGDATHPQIVQIVIKSTPVKVD